MIVTINTDASWFYKYKIGSYAYWIMSDVGKLSKYGSFKDSVENATCAELMAIVNSLHGLSKSHFKNIHRIIINTDCLNVIHYLNRDQAAIKRYRIKQLPLHLIAQSYYKYKREYFKDAFFELRHVQAHTDLTNARKFVNDWCDKAAKKALGEKIKIIEISMNQKVREQ